MHYLVKPNAWVALRLPSDTIKVLQLVPNTTISLGKYGSFQSNLVIGRPYNVTYEVVGAQDGQSHTGLRVVPAAELHADVIAEENASANSALDDTNVIGGDGVEFSLVGENGEVLMRSNRETIDDSARQTLTMEEIEALKRDGANAGQDIIAKLMLSHTAIDEKTKFSLAKYKLTKTRKFLKRFTILSMDVPMLTQYLTDEKDNAKILEISQEMIALAGCWANVHFASKPDQIPGSDELDHVSGGRWLMVDDTGGLVVAALAERMGILYPDEEEDESENEKEGIEEKSEERVEEDEEMPEAEDVQVKAESRESSPKIFTGPSHQDPNPRLDQDPTEQTDADLNTQSERPPRPPYQYKPRDKPFITSNTLTIIHNNAQPNLFFLKYFNHDPNNPSPSHPLSHHLHSLSWLQLLSPSADPAYSQRPPDYTPDELANMKSGKRSTYFRKMRRHLRTKAVVDSTREGGFDGLIITSNMSPISILQHTIPLLKGGAQVVIYSPVIEPLVELADLYSISRRTAFQSTQKIKQEPITTQSPNSLIPLTPSTESQAEKAAASQSEDFPLNPTLLLSVTVQTSKIRKWQVLPGRTHPLMTGRGGAEGYLFTGVRVIPAEGKVEARGNFGKKRGGEKAGVVDRTNEGEGDVKGVKRERID